MEEWEGEEGSVLAGQFQLGTEIPSPNPLLRLFLARRIGGGGVENGERRDVAMGGWDKLLKVALGEESAAALRLELEVLKAAGGSKRRWRPGGVGRLCGSGGEGACVWLVRERPGSPLAWSGGLRETKELVWELRAALASLEELHSLGFLLGDSLRPSSFAYAGEFGQSCEADERSLVIAELSGARRMDKAGRGLGQGRGSIWTRDGVYTAREDLLRLLICVSGAWSWSGPGWAGLDASEAEWVQWTASSLLFATPPIPPSLNRLWNYLISLPPKTPIDYGNVQDLLRQSSPPSLP